MLRANRSAGDTAPPRWRRHCVQRGRIRARKINVGAPRTVGLIIACRGQGNLLLCAHRTTALPQLLLSRVRGYVLASLPLLVPKKSKSTAESVRHGILSVRLASAEQQRISNA